jgi:ubiquinone/menaquinone biosynthesis C-methylase UbiE
MIVQFRGSLPSCEAAVMDKPETRPEYIPALKYDWLTTFFDPIIWLTMPERKFRTALIRQAKIAAGQRVLDFGTGTAALSLLAKQLVPESEITGVDIDAKIIGIARKKIALARMPINIDQYDGTSLPYSDEYFDRVITSLVFHHLARRRKEIALKEIRRVLKPNGELHVADWGKARTIVERLLFVPVQVLDGFEPTADNVQGLLPTFIANAGFVDVVETMTFSTVFGTLSLYRAKR